MEYFRENKGRIYLAQYQTSDWITNIFHSCRDMSQWVTVFVVQT